MTNKTKAPQKFCRASFDQYFIASISVAIAQMTFAAALTMLATLVILISRILVCIKSFFIIFTHKKILDVQEINNKFLDFYPAVILGGCLIFLTSIIIRRRVEGLSSVLLHYSWKSPDNRNNGLKVCVKFLNTESLSQKTLTHQPSHQRRPAGLMPCKYMITQKELTNYLTCFIYVFIPLGRFLFLPVIVVELALISSPCVGCAGVLRCN